MHIRANFVEGSLVEADTVNGRTITTHFIERNEGSICEPLSYCRLCDIIVERDLLEGKKAGFSLVFSLFHCFCFSLYFSLLKTRANSGEVTNLVTYPWRSIAKPEHANNTVSPT